MKKKENLILIMIIFCLYVLNQNIKNIIPIKFIRWFAMCYFNDIIGSMGFIAYCNIITDFYNKEIRKLWQILTVLLCSGIFWEYITPLYRKDTITDVWDIGAYMFGGVIYWMIEQIFSRREEE